MITNIFNPRHQARIITKKKKKKKKKAKPLSDFFTFNYTQNAGFIKE
jgi:hypothetical protein